MKLDHLAICAADLAAGVAWAEDRIGVALGPAGRHARFGTHNRLLGLGDGLYLEVIAPEPGAPVDGPRWFGLDTPPATPGLGNWICRVPDLDAALADFPECGRAVDLARDALRWRISVPEDGRLPMDAALPTLLQWQVATPPGDSLPPSGVRFLGLEVTHPQAAALACRVRLPGVTYRTGPGPRLRARLDTPRGPVIL
jgi:hypothetical protein